MNELQVVERQEVQAFQNQMITPAGTIEDVVKQFHLYQELKTKLATEDDFQTFKQKVKKPNGGYEWKDKVFPKKSFVRKVQRFFNISCEITQDEPLKDENGKIIAWIAKVRAVHLGTGAFQDGDGSCSFDEKADNGKTIHNIRAHAITRAKNRAILDLVGFGEVTAEELPLGYTGDEPEPEPTPQPPRGRQPQQQPTRNTQAKPQQQQVRTAPAKPVAQAQQQQAKPEPAAQPQQQPAGDRNLDAWKALAEANRQQQPKKETNQRGRFFAICAKRGIKGEKTQKALVFKFTGKLSRAEVTNEEYKTICDFLEKASNEEVVKEINEGAESLAKFLAKQEQKTA